MEDYGERTTGTRDEHYDLISVLYHALKGADNCDHYAMDAEAEGKQDLADFFREAQGGQQLLAERAKDLLGISVSPSGVDAAPETSTREPGRGAPPGADAPRTPPDGGR
ncbi:MAG: hypothetical protein ACR2HO_12080 [Rubrobacteraceae bacterium]